MEARSVIQKQLKQNFKTPLALLIGTILFNPVHAADLIVIDGGEDSKTINDGSTWQGNVILGELSGAEIVLSGGSTWNGSAGNNANTPVDDASVLVVDLSENSIWNGNVSGTLDFTTFASESTLNADIDVKGSVNLDFRGSDFTGKISSTGNDASSMNYVYVNLHEQSLWKGDVTGVYANVLLFAEGGSSLQSNISGQNLSFSTNIYNQSEWVGNVTNTVDDDNACGCLDIHVGDNSNWQGDAAIYLDGSAGATTSQYIHLSGGSTWNGNSSLIAENTNGNYSHSSIGLFDNAVWNGNVVLSGEVESNINLDSGALWQGNLVLENYDDNCLYCMPSDISIYGSQWVGHIVSDGAYTDLEMDNAQWTITGDSKLNSIELVNATDSIRFASLTSERKYHTLTVTDLIGSGNYTMRAGYYGPGDHGNDVLIITGDKNLSGYAPTDNIITVLNNGRDNTHGTDILTIVETVDGLDQFTMPNDVELGGYVYTLEQDGTNWILRPGAKGGSWQPVISDPADAAANSVNVNYLMTYAETQTLYQRMGDLRHSQSEGDVWVRGYHGGFSKLGSGLMSGFDMDYNGMQLGVDKKLVLESGDLYLGTMFGMTTGKQDYQTGDGTVKSRSVGIYGSYLTSGGFYIDGLVKYNTLKNTFNVRDSMGQGVGGSGDSKGFAASIEAGKRFHFNEEKNGVYIEPQIQLSMAWQDKNTINVSNGLNVELDSYTSTLGRVGALVGYEMSEGSVPANIYFKTSYVKEFDGKTNYALNGSKEAHSFKGDWWTNGVGVSFQTKDNHNFYMDMEKSNGDSFNQYQINAGYRFSF